jgi:hypothetical protein
MHKPGSTFLLPALILLGHTFYALSKVVLLLTNSQHMQEESISVFEDVVRIEIATLGTKRKYDENQSTALREFQVIASTALSTGDLSQYVYAQSYIESYLNVVLNTATSEGFENLKVAYKDLITTTQNR